MKKSLLMLLISFIVGAALCCSKAADEQKRHLSGTAGKGDQGYTYKITLEKIQFDWSIDNSNLRIKLFAQTPGWIGIGFNPTEEMKDAEFILGFATGGTVTISNQHGVSKTLHSKNTDLGGVDRVINPSGKETNNGTEISFTIPYKTGDKLAKPTSVKEDIPVLLAYGQSKHLMQLHSFRAKLTVNLSSGQYSVILMTEK